MGYPMTWGRVVCRNSLGGDYDPVAGQKPTHFDPRPMIAGDMRRLERDSLDSDHLKEYARVAGIKPEQAKRLLDAFFQGNVWSLPTPVEPSVRRTSMDHGGVGQVGCVDDDGLLHVHREDETCIVCKDHK